MVTQVLRRPQWPADARRIPADVVSRDIPVWNMTLYTLRELCYTDQDLSERCASSPNASSYATSDVFFYRESGEEYTAQFVQHTGPIFPRSGPSVHKMCT